MEYWGQYYFKVAKKLNTQDVTKHYPEKQNIVNAIYIENNCWQVEQYCRQVQKKNVSLFCDLQGCLKVKHTRCCQETPSKEE